MPARERQRPPSGHGEILCDPPFSDWADVAISNAESTRSWPGELHELRWRARAEAIEAACAYSCRIGVEPRRDAGDLIVMTGHQPTLFHPGVWVKNFLVQRFTEEVSSLGINLVVDTDAAGVVELVAPCMSPEVSVCRVVLAQSPDGVSYAHAPVPDAAARAAFREGGIRALGTLPAPAIARHFTSFCDKLDSAAGSCDDLGMLMTAARRAYERAAGTDYLELPVSAQAEGAALRFFAASIISDARRFAAVHNRALARYRALTGTRSAAQPFPDLAIDAGRVEVPFWLLADGRRHPLAVEASGRLCAAKRVCADAGADAFSVARELADGGWVVAPKAIALTLYERLFVADLFVHGVGGGRYDRVTDEVMREYFGIEPPRFAVASITLMLPLGRQPAGDVEVAALEQRLHRLKHNPDQALGDIDFDTPGERERVEALAREKAALVTAIAQPGAERATLGLRIRQVNAGLAALLRPLAEETGLALARARSAREMSTVLTDRTYPYCLWDPREVMDKTR